MEAAGAALAVVGLGLQACKRLTNYVSACRHQSKDLSRVAGKLGQLERSLEAVVGILAAVPASALTDPTRVAINLAVDAVEQLGKDFESLESFWKKCGGLVAERGSSSQDQGRSNTSGLPGRDDSKVKKRHSPLKKATFYFRKDELKDLEQIVDSSLLVLGAMQQAVAVGLAQAQISHAEYANRMLVSTSQADRRNQASLREIQSSLEEMKLSRQNCLIELEGDVGQGPSDVALLIGRQMRPWLHQTLAIFRLFLLLLWSLVISTQSSIRLSLSRSIWTLPTDNILFRDCVGRVYSLPLSMASSWQLFKPFLEAQFQESDVGSLAQRRIYWISSGPDYVFTNDKYRENSNEEWSKIAIGGTKLSMTAIIWAIVSSTRRPHTSTSRHNAADNPRDGLEQLVLHMATYGVRDAESESYDGLVDSTRPIIRTCQFLSSAKFSRKHKCLPVCTQYWPGLVVIKLHTSRATPRPAKQRAEVRWFIRCGSHS